MDLRTTQNIVAQNALAMGDGNGGQTLLSILEAKVFKILTSKTLGIHITARSLSGANAFYPGGTVIYRKPQVFKVTNYASDGSDKKTPQVKTLGVVIDTPKSIKYEIETLDMSRFNTEFAGEDIANAIVAQFSASAVSSIVAYLDCLWLQTAITSATTSGNVTTLTAFDGTFASVKTRDQAYNEVYGSLVQNFNDLVNTINSESIGVDRNEILGVTTTIFKSSAIGGVGAYGSDATRIDLLRNRLGESLANAGDGVGIVGDVPLYTTVFLDKDKTVLDNFIDGNATAGTFDTKGVGAVLLHQEAIALPMTALQSFVEKNYNNGNPVFIHKFVHGSAVIRPTLIKIIKYFVKTPPV